jgi:hypothetical protein
MVAISWPIQNTNIHRRSPSACGHLLRHVDAQVGHLEANVAEILTEAALESLTCSFQHLFLPFPLELHSRLTLSDTDDDDAIVLETRQAEKISIK